MPGLFSNLFNNSGSGGAYADEMPAGPNIFIDNAATAQYKWAQQAEWKRRHTPLTPETQAYISEATGGQFNPKTIGEAEEVSEAMKTFAPPPKTYGEIIEPSTGNKIWSEKKPGDITELKPPPKLITTVDPQTGIEIRGEDVSGAIVKAPGKFTTAPGPYGSKIKKNEWTGEESQVTAPPTLYSTEAGLLPPNLAAGKMPYDKESAGGTGMNEKDRKNQLKSIASERSKINARINQLEAGKKNEDEENRVNIDKTIEDLQSQRNNLDEQYARLGGDVRSLGADQTSFNERLGRKSAQKFAWESGEQKESEPLRLDAEAGIVNKEKQAAIDKDQQTLNSKYKSDPIGARKRKNDIVWIKTDKGWVIQK